MVPSPRSDQEVRILLVGEDGVGKTSLILALISEEFPNETPARCEEVTIPADVTPEKVPARIVDYSAQQQSETQLAEELRLADVVCLVYDVNNDITVEKISSYWMPSIRSTLGANHSMPVILVGNKSDSEQGVSMDQILPIMNEFPEIETCVECSARSFKNISELFYYAQKAVLHPTGPLYVAEDKELTQNCKRALVRVFKVSDADNDGLLSDTELNEFQVRCFQVPLTPDAIHDVKAVVRKHISDGVLDNSLTLKGFLFLHTLFIQRGRHETTWTVLRRFGYDNSLQLEKQYLYPPLKVPRGSSTELSAEGLIFLTTLFEKYDEDKDGCLSSVELQNLFSVCSQLPWSHNALNSMETNEQGWVTYNGYLSYWALTTMLDVPRTLEYLAYLGFHAWKSHDSQLSAIRVTRDKRLDWQNKQTSRSVFQCHLIGTKDVGKTAFLQGFIGKDLRKQAGLNKRHLSGYAVNTVSVHGQTKTLILHEIDVMSPEDALTHYEQSCDVVCFIYDSSNPKSFEYCARMYKKYFNRTRLPCLIVATKMDRREVIQAYELQPVEFCQRYHLPPPLNFSATEDGLRSTDVYHKLATLAAFPHLKHIYYLHDGAWWVKLSLGAAAAALVGFLVFKNI